MIEGYERPLLPGWIYPCTVDDIRDQLETLPAEDLEGLRVVGLVPSTRKNCSIYGRYTEDPLPRILLYSHRKSLAYKQPLGTRRGDVETGGAIERQFGMRFERVGGRWYCYWSAEDLRRFVLKHVLIHEVGHHVQCMDRQRKRLTRELGRHVEEQFADAYACRYLRERGGPSTTRSS